MDSCCLFFRRMPSSDQFYALAIWARLPLRDAGLEVRRFSSEEEFASALYQAGVTGLELTRLRKALQQSGRTMTPFTKAQAAALRVVPLLELLKESPSNAPRPAHFDVERITARALPYQILGTHNEATSSGGVLPAGLELWLDGRNAIAAIVPSGRAYVKGIGLIALDTRWLRRRDPVSTITGAGGAPKPAA